MDSPQQERWSCPRMQNTVVVLYRRANAQYAMHKSMTLRGARAAVRIGRVQWCCSGPSAFPSLTVAPRHSPRRESRSPVVMWAHASSAVDKSS
jgi:hypothetical protein